RKRGRTVSRSMITGILRNEMDYDGLIFTDALEMKGVTKHFESGQVEAEALVAGNDMLLLPEDIGAAFVTIKEYIADEKLSREQVEASVKRVLRAKYRLGLTKTPELSPFNLREDLNNNRALSIKQKLYEEAITLARNRDDLLPFRNLDSLKIASLALGTQKQTPFQDRLQDYHDVELFQTDKNVTSAEIRTFMRDFEEKDVVIVSLHNLSSFASKNFGLTESERNFIKQLSARKKVVLINFGSPYALKYFDDMQWLVNANDEDPMAQDAAAQAVFGAIAMSGRLPVTAAPSLPFNTGLTTNPMFRLAYAYPESVGLNSDTLQMIDDLMKEAIDLKAIPGGVVLVAKDGKIVFEKAYGHHTYGGMQKVSTDDIYDLASITKIAASTISVMKLQDEGKLSIYQPIGRYLPEAIGTNKADITLYDAMAHRAGLKSWIPFFEQTITNVARSGTGIVSEYYRRRPDETYGAKVTDQLFLRRDFQDSIWQQIYDSPVAEIKEYVYSDLSYYMVNKIVKNQTGQYLDQYADETFYKPLGLQTMTYKPLEKFDKQNIVPTEEDRYWRNQKIHGHVHDMGAAMLDGVSGHAGLFGNARDLAVVM
ncbi:MAG: serine hydrolase, partial [Bacteroidota bacterium]